MTRVSLLGAAILAMSLGLTAVAQPPTAGPPRTDPSAMAADAAKAAELLEKAYGGSRPPESVRMLNAILRGSRMSPGEGWFGPAQSRYSWEWLAKRCAVDPSKGRITRDQFRGADALFARLDRNKDGRIGPDDLDWSDRNPYLQMAAMVNRLFYRIDMAGTGKVTREELLRFFDKAAQGKDFLTADDLRDALLGGMPSGFAAGDMPTPDVLIRGLFAGEIGSLNEGPQVNQPAPAFTLKTADGRDEIQLTKLIGPKPLVLVFGNFTCGPFRGLYPDVDALYHRYKADANFLMVYVREAHPTDGWKMESNARVGVAVKQPVTYADRAAVAGQFCTRLKPSMPVAVDEINDIVGHAYSGMPARLYVIDRSGKVAYKSGRGPFGFRAGEMEQALIMLLLEQGDAGKPAAAPGSRTLLPASEKSLPAALPAWAQALAPTMPKTVAAMLELDALHRTKNPIEPQLRAKMRWVAAHANRNSYGEAYALADLKRAGATAADVQALQTGPKLWPPDQAAALTFARKLTEAAYTVTDDEVAALRKAYGDANVVAMVQLLAYANFQDRLTHALGVAVEEGGPLPPLDVRFRKPFTGGADAPARDAVAGPGGSTPPEQVADADWKRLDFEFLKNQMETQKAREPRIPVPPFSAIRPHLPPTFPKDRELKIKWSLVCTGYQPELAAAWSLCTRSFGEEAKQDRVFEESLFWVVTRSLQCYY